MAGTPGHLATWHLATWHLATWHLAHLWNITADFTVEAEEVVFVGILYAWNDPIRKVPVKYGLVRAGSRKIWWKVLLVVKEKIWLARVLDESPLRFHSYLCSCVQRWFCYEYFWRSFTLVG